MNLKIGVRLIIVLLLLMLSAGRTNAVVEVSGSIDNDTVWTSDDTILVTGPVTVNAPARLLIEPGTVVAFQTNLRIMVYGNMTAVGDEYNPIIFTSATDTAGGQPQPGNWYGLDFQVNSTGELTHCQIRYPIIGIYIYSAAVALTDCLVENFMLFGLEVNGGTQEVSDIIPVRHCTFRQTVSSALGTGTGIYAFYRARLNISRTTVNRCDIGLDVYSYNTNVPSFEVYSCDFSDNDRYGIYLRSGG